MYLIKTSDDVKIAVYDPNPTGHNAILFIHGWPLAGEVFEYQVSLLLNKGYRVVTVDLRGFGNSDMPADGYNYDRMARDIYDVVEKIGLWDFVLAGFSMGGAIALRYMRVCRGTGVRKLMLLAAAAPSYTKRPGFLYGVTREAVDKLIDGARTDRAQLCYDFSHKQLLASPHSEAIKNWFEKISISASGYGTIQAAIALRDEDGRADLAAVHVPTAIFQGIKDVVVPADLTIYQYKNIPGSVLYQLSDSGHGLMYDELEKFNHYMMDFLEER